MLWVLYQKVCTTRLETVRYKNLRSVNSKHRSIPQSFCLVLTLGLFISNIYSCRDVGCRCFGHSVQIQKRYVGVYNEILVEYVNYGPLFNH